MTLSILLVFILGYVHIPGGVALTLGVIRAAGVTCGVVPLTLDLDSVIFQRVGGSIFVPLAVTRRFGTWNVPHDL